jgi:peptidoglycan/xylan/chitin deacetylase (PgdA/CDA1 family)
MKRRLTITRIIALALLLGLLTSLTIDIFSQNDLSQKLSQEQGKNKNLTSEMQQLNSQYQTLQSSYDDLQKKLEDTAQSSSSPAKVAYLTFDDGPTSVTPHLLDVLKENNVKATFFITFMSLDTAQKRAWLKQEVDDGYTIGVHSWSHKYDVIYANEQNFLNDFNKMKDIIVSATGVQPKVCRFPGGIGNTVSITASGGQIIMPKLVADVKAMGFTPFDWNAGGEDADTPYPTTEQLVKDILNDAKGHNDVVILMHDTHEFSIDVVPEVVQNLRAQGYTFKMLTPSSQKMQQPFGKKK